MPPTPVSYPLPANVPQPADLRTLIRSVSNCWPRRLPDAPSWRPQVAFDGSPGPVRIDELDVPEVAAAVDGIQRTWLLRVCDDRPVTLAHVAAAAYLPGQRPPLALEERLFIVVSTLDQSEVSAAAAQQGIPLVVLPAVSAQAVRWHTDAAVADFRSRLEQRCVDTAVAAAPSGLLLVDGSVRNLPAMASNVVGVVKTTDGAVYDTDTEALRRLPVGARSRVLRIGRDTTSEHPVWSTHVRLHEAFSSLHHGLIRIEVADRDLVDGAAAACFAHRQRDLSVDPRGDRHLAPVREVELLLRARSPQL